MTIPTDDELDAAVSRLEPRLFMTLGARSRRRRVARILSGTAAGAGLIAAGLAIGVYLVPVLTPPGPAIAIPKVATSAPGASRILTSVTCHDGADRVVAEIRVPKGADDPAALCASVTATRQLGTIKAPVVACAGASGTAEVYPSTESSPATCAKHGTQPYRSTK